MIKNMMEDHKNCLSEQEVSQDESNRPLPAVPSDTEDDANDEQILWDGEFAMILAAEEIRKAEEWAVEQEARTKEQEVVNEKLQQILRMLENTPEPGPRSKAERESSSDEETMVKMTMKHAADKEADREG